MKLIKCAICKATDIVVDDNWEPEYCCDGDRCCCGGMLTNLVLCDKCQSEIIDVEGILSDAFNRI